jgi:hypothetical protein
VVGERVGCEEGFLVGKKDGEHVGDMLGCNEGNIEGWCVGRWDGCAVGCSEGCRHNGCDVGMTVGNEYGRKVGY